MKLLMSIALKFSFLITVVFLTITPALALTISSAPTVGVSVTRDEVNNITYYTGTEANANINFITVEEKLNISHVSLNDSYNPNIMFADGTNITWSSAYNLIVNAPQNIMIGSGAKFTSNGYGNLILRADYAANNDGTIIRTGSGPAVFLNGDATVKIYYHPNDYTVPTNFGFLLGSTFGKLYAYMAINDISDLLKMTRNLKGNYALATNIDVRGALFTPIGTPSNPFNGRFDGQGYTISNLNITYPNLAAVGFFGAINSAYVENLKLVNEIVNGREMVGGLTGMMTSSSISKIAVIGNISGESRVGGLIGSVTTRSGGWLIESYSEGLIRLREDNGGGLVGDSENIDTIDNSYSNAIISSQSTGNPNEGIVGGLVGRNSGGTRFRYCYATGLNNATRLSGGLIGNYGTTPFIIANFWDTQTTKQNYSTGNRTTLIGVKGLTTVEMQLKKTYEDLFWDFNFIWGIDEGKSYPYLLWSRKTAPWTAIASGPNHELKIVG